MALFGSMNAFSGTNAQPETIIILLDISLSTPVSDPQAQARLVKTLHDAISPIPLKSRIEVRTLGDDADTVYSSTDMVLNYKTRDGDTAENLSKAIPAKIIRFFQTGKSQGMSALTNAIWDANKLCEDSCRVLFFTDGMQNTPEGVHYPSDYKKPLPELPGLDLSHMKVSMIGVGSGLESSSDTRVKIESHWLKWFTKAKAKEIHISRF